MCVYVCVCFLPCGCYMWLSARCGDCISPALTTYSNWKSFCAIWVMTVNLQFEMPSQHRALGHLYTLQEMCCGFLLSREMWYRKSVLPGTGAGWAELKSIKKYKNSSLFSYFSRTLYVWSLKCINISSLWLKNPNKKFGVCNALLIAPFSR